MKKKTIVILIILIFVAIAIGAIIVKNSNKNNCMQDGIQKIKMSEVTRSVFYAPQYVAINNGYFKDCGIEIELTTGQGADAVMTSVLSGESQIGFAGPEASIYVYNEGKEDYTQVFAQLTKRDGSFLVSKEKNDNFNWSDLKGKTVIPGRKGGVPYMTLEYVIKQKGLNPKTDLKLDDSIKFDLMASAFTSGTADYVTLFEPTASNIQKLGKGYIVASVGKEAGEIPYTAYFAKKSYIQNNEKMIQEFTNAIYNNVCGAKVDLIARLGKSTIKVNELLDLKVGDIITLDTKVDGDIELDVSEARSFKCRPGLIKNKNGVVITDSVKKGV